MNKFLIKFFRALLLLVVFFAVDLSQIFFSVDFFLFVNINDVYY